MKKFSMQYGETIITATGSVKNETGNLQFRQPMKFLEEVYRDARYVVIVKWSNRNEQEID